MMLFINFVTTKSLKTGSGKIVHHQGGHRHLATKKSPKRKRRLRKATTLSKAMSSRTKKMIQ